MRRRHRILRVHDFSCSELTGDGEFAPSPDSESLDLNRTGFVDLDGWSGGLLRLLPHPHFSKTAGVIDSRTPDKSKAIFHAT